MPFLRSMLRRRDFLGNGGLLSFFPPALGAAGRDSAAEVYHRLGVKTVINAYETQTFLGGSIMLQRVTAAMEKASRHFVDMHERLRKSGERITQLAGAEAALVTSVRRR